MRKILMIPIVFLVFFFVISVGSVSAKIMTNNKGEINVAKTEIINDDLFIGAQTAEIDGTVNGDVFIGAQTIKVSGTINGSLHAGANTLILDGVVKGNVYVGGQSVIVNKSTIGGSLLIGAATVNVDKDTIIGGSLLAGAGSLSLNAQVKRSVYAGVGSLIIGSDAKIGKDLYYASGTNPDQVTISTGAKIAGTVYKSETNVPKDSLNMAGMRKQMSAVFAKIKAVTSMISFVGALIIGFLYLKLFEKHFTSTSDLVSKSFAKTLGTGFIVMISFVPGFIILLLTVIGIPLAGLALLVFLVYLYMAKIVVGLSLGKWINKKFNWKMSGNLTFALGLFVIYLIKMIPLVGFFSGLVVLWLGLGALTLRMFSKSE